MPRSPKLYGVEVLTIKISIMKTITLTLDRSKRATRETMWVLSTGVTTEDFVTFKRDYQYYILRSLYDMRNGGGQKTFDLNNLPVLSSSLDDLKRFMQRECLDNNTTEGWNSAREKAKFSYTFPTIAQLDASGFIKKVVKIKS